MSNEVIYNIIKNKDYIIRPFLFKIIKENNLSINETLLLIYLSNQEHPELELSLINNITTLKNEEILSAFSSLTSKGLINTEIKKDGERVVEEISLDGIYKLAAMNINKKVTKMEYEFINAWINSGMNEDIIKEALKEATYNGVSNLRYIDKIIYEWKKKGYKTVEQVRNNKFKKEEKEETEKVFFDYDWLNEN